MTGWTDRAYSHYLRIVQEEAEDKIGTPASAWMRPHEEARAAIRPFGYDIVPAYQLRPGMTIITPTGSVIVEDALVITHAGDYVVLVGRKSRRIRPGVSEMAYFTDLIDPLQEMPVRIHR